MASLSFKLNKFLVLLLDDGGQPLKHGGRKIVLMNHMPCMCKQLVFRDACKIEKSDY